MVVWSSEMIEDGLGRGYDMGFNFKSGVLQESDDVTSKRGVTFQVRIPNFEAPTWRSSMLIFSS